MSEALYHRLDRSGRETQNQPRLYLVGDSAPIKIDFREPGECDPVHPSEAADTSETSRPDKPVSYPRWIQVASVAVAILTISGAVIGFVHPGEVTGAILPIGLVSWWLLTKVIDRRDRRTAKQ